MAVSHLDIEKIFILFTLSKNIEGKKKTHYAETKTQLSL